MARSRWLGALFGAVLVGAAACGSNAGVFTDRAEPVGDTAESTNPPPSVPEEPEATEPTPEVTDLPSTEGGQPAGTLDWRQVGEDTESAILEVPLDYDDPDGETTELYVARHLAGDQDNKIGSLLVNPGGPGFGGSDFGLLAEFIFGEELLERFDIVGWDPRGTGKSEPAIDCIDDYDAYYAGTDITPDDEAERQQIIDIAEDLATRCAENNADIIEHVGTNNSARDMDTLRQALGEDEISYFGFSYGSELGTTWATLFPDTVRAAVVDGAADPNADPLESGLQQTKGFERTLATYLASCSDDTSCAFHNDGDAEGAFDALMADLDEDPIPSVQGRPDVTRGVALQAVGQAMYSERFWDQLSDALAAGQRGQGAELLALYDAYNQRKADGTWGNELEAFQTIRCMDETERLTVEEDDANAPKFNAVAPRFSPNTTGSYFCTFFPPSTDPRIEITGAGAGPIVVIGTTGDPATPIESTRKMAESLQDGRLVVVDADQHGGYQVNDCVDDIVHEYLVDLVVPPEETTC